MLSFNEEEYIDKLPQWRLDLEQLSSRLRELSAEIGDERFPMDALVERMFEEMHGEEARSYMEDPENIRDPNEKVAIFNQDGEAVKDKHRLWRLQRFFQEEVQNLDEWKTLNKKCHRRMELEKKMKMVGRRVELAEEIIEARGHFRTLEPTPKSEAFARFLSNILEPDDKKKRAKNVHDTKRKIFRLVLPLVDSGCVSVLMLSREDEKGRFDIPEGKYIFVFHNIMDKSSVKEIAFTARYSTTHGKFAGNIILILDSDGKVFVRSERLADETISLFERLENPRDFMHWVSVETGMCCICHKPLKNRESVEKGIGPICSKYINDLNIDG